MHVPNLRVGHCLMKGSEEPIKPTSESESKKGSSALLPQSSRNSSWNFLTSRRTNLPKSHPGIRGSMVT